MAEKEAQDLKSQGNQCMKDGKHVEAMMHYTHAIKLEPKNHLLYSNRSFAFLKMQSHYHAMEDAKETIKLSPQWCKGYYRKGEVEFAAELHDEALKSYQMAFLLSPEDASLRQAVAKAMAAQEKISKANARVPWMGGGAGFLLGSIIVVADAYLTKRPTLQHFVLQALLMIIFAAIGYILARAYLTFMKSQRESLLDAPLDLFGEGDSSSSSREGGGGGETGGSGHPDQNDSQSSKPRKGGAAMGKARFRKGKS